MMKASEKRFHQCGKKLLQTHIRLVKSDSADGADADDYLLIRRGKSDKKLARIKAAILHDWVKADFLQRAGDGFILSAVGRAHLRRHNGPNAGDDFTAQHHIDMEAGDETRARQLATTPLQYLKARGRGKSFGLNTHELEAGGRLHDDFQRAMRTPHQTMDWTRPVYVDGGGQGETGDIPVSVLDAQRRLAKALAYVGPGLADMVVDVCCSEIGLEATEKKFALPRRSAKVMLKLGLMRLAVHYGYQSSSAAVASFRMR
jgi:hypothetical protein